MFEAIDTKQPVPAGWLSELKSNGCHHMDFPPTLARRTTVR